ncbi:DNA-3-methyladenine glycosylase II [Fructilactobacillus florum 8D]|uniref:Putative 3-methyladenine DNA glycosylase n=1 Tax=Fructilactobacillus florum 8D TaxID=1221538 RepID=W9EH24_9LACO|nr:DNA-3-methyladenine glycosylase [Fructilactobacillus florum]EKK20417.1 DNA-3-methyladenine glycosylase II [Fructilactobacillus florum 2F]ETO40561.1 DNA-3-methyladenine glycosylase II [Fructilactobacillus florum 8D]
MKQTRIPFFASDSTAKLAQQLLGKKLIYQTVAGTMSGWIVEVEAYLGMLDEAAHAYQGRCTPSNEPLYGPPGTVYIYSIHFQLCLDIATQAVGVPEGILIRALEPDSGRGLMEHHRGKTGLELTNGPGKLMSALGITDKRMNFQLFGEVPLSLDFVTARQPQAITAGPRIGVGAKGSWAKQPLRYYVTGNPYVSKLPKRSMDLVTHGWQI